MKKACLIKWVIAILCAHRAIGIIIKHSWLKVDKAIIFLKSIHKPTYKLAIRRVNLASRPSIREEPVVIAGVNRTNMYTPAVTSVEE
jgi:hypothetical protein